MKVIIAGAGVRGSSLTQVYALAGDNTVLFNRSQSGLERGRHLIELNQATLVKENLYTQKESDAAMARISFTSDLSVFEDCGLIVETIIEDLEEKRKFWREVSAIAPADALLATNTSGLHISDIAEAVERPERFMGQHWLNPAHLLPLCELIVGSKTSDETVQRMRQLVIGLGKKPVIVKDINGFIINRIQFSLLREALYIVESGAASFEDVDTVLKAGMGLRYAALGPFGIADFGGLDTFEHISSYLNSELCDSKDNNKLKAMIKEGKLGVKSGEGFYDYSGDKADNAIRERDRLYIELARVLYFNNNSSDRKGTADEK